MKRIIIEECPYCGSKMLVYGYQNDSGNVFTDVRGSVFGSPIEHVICKDCGSIVYSRVLKPDLFKDFISEEAKAEFEHQLKSKPEKKKDSILEIIVDE